MKKRPFGNTGRNVAEVGLGTWQIGSGWGPVDEKVAMATLTAAWESGTDLFDTADVYGMGQSERLIGRFLKETRANVFVATKLGRFSPPGWPENFSRETIRAHAEASLTRLGVESLDLIQLHCVPTEVLAAGEVFDHLRELKKEGKIRQFGASVESMDQALICLKQEGFASLQIIFNIFRQKPIDTLFAQAKARRVGILVRLPLASGLLAGKMNAQTTFDPNDHRNFNRDGGAFNVGETFAGLRFEKGLELVDRLRAMAPGGMSLADLALRWCLDHEAVSAIIPGARNAEQARRNAAASAIPPLGPAMHERLAQFYRDAVADHIRGPY